MRAYLLGTLAEKESAVLEEIYFSDRDAFRIIRWHEDELIRDYLRNRLVPPDLEQFESRYLIVPELAKRVREVERELGIHNRIRRSSLRLSAASLALVVGGFSLWWLSGGGTAQPSRVLGPPEPAPLVALRLIPGVKMSSDKPAHVPNLAGKRLSLTLELPGRTSPVEYLVVLSSVDPNGHSLNVWSGEARSSAGVAHSQQVVVRPDPSILSPGDYIAEVDTVQGEPIEKYIFRIEPPP